MNDWLHQKDSAYSWKVENEEKESLFSTYLISFTSQNWRDETEVKNVTWTHDLKIYVPEGVKAKKALFLISGGVHGEDRTKELCSCIPSWAQESSSVVCEISLVPSQHIVFKDEIDARYEEVGRVEDQLVAFSWKKYLETQDETWPLQMPMTKAVISAFDCIEEFSKNTLGFHIREFVVAGLSKRGWTAWLVAAHDLRVIGVIPMVIDLLNLRESFAHHFDVYGKWAPAIRDYAEIELDKWVYTDAFSRLLKLIEPFHYREQLTMPKYIINSASDDFFLPDSSQFYFQDLLEPKYLRYVPNCSHNLFESEDAMSVAGAFYQMVIENKPLPKFTWSQKHPHQIEIECLDKPIEVNFWRALNKENRDFRFNEVGSLWAKETVSLRQDGYYTFELEIPKKGYCAYFIELKYLSMQKHPLIFTTDVYVMTQEKSS